MLNDGVEVNTYNTNPLEPDSDFDGINDADENGVTKVQSMIKNYKNRLFSFIKKLLISRE